MTKTLREWIVWADENKVAIGHFNISDSEGFRAVVEGAKTVSDEIGKPIPVIIGVSEGERDFIGLDEAVSLVNTAKEDGLPVFLNADHTYSVERAREAVDAGVDSIIIDGASESYEENVDMTRDVANYVRSIDPLIIVEGELGYIGKSSKELDDVPEGVSVDTQTDPEEAKRFVKETGVDLLAPSVGNVHGMVKGGNPKLNIELIQDIREVAEVPLVLHGGSGISDEEFVEAIEAGVVIIHINTELRKAYKEGVEEGLKSEEIAPYKFLAEGVEEMKKVVVKKLKLFNGVRD